MAEVKFGELIVMTNSVLGLSILTMPFCFQQVYLTFFSGFFELTYNDFISFIVWLNFGHAFIGHKCSYDLIFVQASSQSNKHEKNENV